MKVRPEVLLVDLLHQTDHPPSGAPAPMDVLVDSMPLGIVVLVIHAPPSITMHLVARVLAEIFNNSFYHMLPTSRWLV